MPDLIQPGSQTLRTLTPARIALARTGSSLTTPDILDLALAHAEARDAVHANLSLPTLLAALHQRSLNPIALHSAAPDRITYLRRPDLGRRLSEASAHQLHGLQGELVILLADGLSALAVDRHAVPLLDALLPLLTPHFALAPILIAEQARVALADEAGKLLSAKLTLVLIGERPGLSSPDSLGAYLTWDPRPGRTDAERNCVSNIRTAGLGYAGAAARIAYLCLEAKRLGLSGTTIKEAAELPQLL